MLLWNRAIAAHRWTSPFCCMPSSYFFDFDFYSWNFREMNFSHWLWHCFIITVKLPRFFGNYPRTANYNKPLKKYCYKFQMLLGLFPTASSDKAWKTSKVVNASNSLQVQWLLRPSFGALSYKHIVLWLGELRLSSSSWSVCNHVSTEFYIKAIPPNTANHLRFMNNISQKWTWVTGIVLRVR